MARLYSIQYYKELYGSVENLITVAKNGNIIAQADLGMAYSEGVEDFVEKDFQKAVGWLNTAIDSGYVDSFVFTKFGELLDLEGAPQHKRKAYEIYHRAAKLGSAAAQLDLAEMYRCGVDGVVNEDLKEAFEWYRKAADEIAFDDNIEVGTMRTMDRNAAKRKALKCLYLNYLDGDCPEGQPQLTKAVHYLTRAAELGDNEAQLDLGKIYLTGSCEQIKDVRKARRWLEKAAFSGDVMAKQLLQQCKQSDDTQYNPSEISKEALKQSFTIMDEKLKERADANVNPFVISQPVAFSEEMLRQYNWSPTARIYLQAYKMVQKGIEILNISNFTDGSGISLIAHGYLIENSILQAFPEIRGSLLPNIIIQLCEENLSKNPCFFEGLLLCYILQGFERKVSENSMKRDAEKTMCIRNLIHFIQKAEPNSLPTEEPFEFDKNYSSWLHVLFYHLGAIYTFAEEYGMAAEAFENSLKHCPSYYESKRALGHSLMHLYIISKGKYKGLESSQDGHTELPPNEPSHFRQMSNYASWTAEKLGDTAETVLKEYLVEATVCCKTYPNVCYYLANLAQIKNNKEEFRKYYELGQDAEEKRLPFFESVNIPLKDILSPLYQLFANVREPARCGNRTCIKEVQESDLKTCGQCRKQKYCSKECQILDWRNHKSTCTGSKGPKTKHGS